MGKVSAAFVGSIVGGAVAVVLLVFWFEWGMPGSGQLAYIDAQRSDYIDLVLTAVTVVLGAVGLAVTVGALVIGLVAFKTLREIKTEATADAKAAAAAKINETIIAELPPKVDAKVNEILPEALPTALMNDDLADRILTAMASRGDLDAVFERVAMRLQGGGPEPKPAKHRDDDDDVDDPSL
jgi:hypothetical protein